MTRQQLTLIVSMALALLATAALVAGLNRLVAVDAGSLPPGVQRIGQAQIAPGLYPPGLDSASQETVLLPDVWRRQTPKRSGVHHYRMELPRVETAVPMAIWVPRLGNRARFWIDDRLVATLGEVEGGSQDYSNRPVLVRLPADTTARGDPDGRNPAVHRLVIEIGGNATRFSGLSPVVWGPLSTLEALHGGRQAWALASGGLAAGGSLLLGISGLLLAAWRRQPVLVFFGLAGLASGARAWLWMWTDPPVHPLVWYTAMDACFGVWACSIAWFALRSVEIRNRWLEGGLIGLMVLMVPATVLAGLGLTARPKEIWLDSTLAIAAVITTLLVVRAWKKPDGVRLSLAVGSVVVLGLSGTDHVNIFFATDPAAYTRAYFSHHMALLFSLFMAVSLAARFDSAVRGEAELRRDLAQKVAAQRLELQQLHEREQARAETQATLRERERIMQDMHDGLGAHLNGLLTLVQRGPLGRAELELELAEAIDQLRLTVDSAQLDQATLIDVLAQIRFRLEPRMKKLGVAMHWQLDELPEVLSADAASHVQKLVLEALSNAIRHARARTIWVEAGLVGGKPRVLIADDGKEAWSPPGTSTDETHPAGAAAPRGRGLQHMHSRAKALGAGLSVKHAAGSGTRVELQW